MPHCGADRRLHRALGRGAPCPALPDRRRGDQGQRLRRKAAAGIHGQGPEMGRGLQVQGRAGAHAARQRVVPGGTHGSHNACGEPRTGAAGRDDRAACDAAQRRADGPAGHPPGRHGIRREGRRDHPQDHGGRPLAAACGQQTFRIHHRMPRMRHAAGALRGRGEALLPQPGGVPAADRRTHHPFHPPQSDGHRGAGRGDRGTAL